MAPQTSSQKQSGAQNAATSNRGQPTDALNLPLPPVTLDFAIRGESRTEGFFQRYVRKGDANDATTAVIGKGGFGTAYRFVRDDSFTPPNSLMDATINSADHDLSRKMDPLFSASKRDSFVDSLSAKESSTKGLSSLHSGNLLIRSSSSVPPSPQIGSAGARVTHPPMRNKAPAVVVVKVCRTPTSGSYDELPKTGVGRTEAKVAAQEIAAGNPIGEHTRIVRGEARLLRYLQMRRILEGNRGRQSHVVRLLADIPMPKTGGKNAQEDEEDENYSGPPEPRLLVFERLVDLDAELTSRGWQKTRQIWSVEKVELVSRDALAGLHFLHNHGIVHGDLKPSNFMRDARTGAVKLIDLGASRRWVRLHNAAKERTTAVEEFDKAVQDGHVQPRRSEEILCEGLGSLTGSPHFMAPEVLLQAGRYLSSDGLAHNVLDDYMSNKNRLPRHPSSSFLGLAYRDFKRGWGIKADIWSWGCSVLSLLLRTIESSKRPSSNTVCAFDFSFESDADALPPLWPLHSSNDSLPRFHQWARLYALRIVSVVEKGVDLPDYTSVLSTPYSQMLQASFHHQDTRPSAAVILEYLDSHTSNNVEYMSEVESHDVGRSPSRANSIAPSFTSMSTMGPSMPEDPHNIDLSVSTSVMTQNPSNNADGRLQGSEQNLIVPIPAPPGVRINSAPSNKMLKVQETHRSLSSPALGHIHGSNTTSPLQSSHVQRLSLLQRPPSFASERGLMNSQRSSIASEINLHLEGQEQVPSPNASIYTAISTPMMDAKSIQIPAPMYNREPEMSRGEEIEEIAAACRSVPHLSTYAGGNGASNDVNPWNASSSQMHRNGKSRRGSIFLRMASSIAPRLQTRESTSSVSKLFASGEQTARPNQGSRNALNRMSGFWGASKDTQQQPQQQQQQGATSDNSPSIEYLHDQPSDHGGSGYNTRDGGQSVSAADVEMRDRSHSIGARSRKSTGYNILGLELGSALQAPLRTVRSFASLRNSTGPSSVQMSQHHSDARQSTLRSPQADRHQEYSSHDPYGGQVLPPSSPQQYYHPRSSTCYYEDATQTAMRHNRASQYGQGKTAYSHGAGQSEHSLPHMTTAGSFANGTASIGPHMPAFLRSDPYGESAYAEGMQAAHTASQHRRQRSWSSIFRRSKRAASQT